MPQPTYRILYHVLDTPVDLQLTIGGWLASRISANESNWLIPAPSSNPGIIEFRPTLLLDSTKIASVSGQLGRSI